MSDVKLSGLTFEAIETELRARAGRAGERMARPVIGSIEPYASGERKGYYDALNGLIEWIAGQKSKQRPMTADEWNARYPIGTPVIVTRDNGQKFPTMTRSAAWTVGDDDPIIMVNGISGGFLLERVQPAQIPADTAPTDTHALRRTSPKGDPFIGCCTKCGKTDLPMSAVHEECQNPSGATQEQALLDTIDGPAPADVERLARLPEKPDERRMFNEGVRLYESNNPLIAIASALSVWHKMAPSGSQREMLAIYSNEIYAAATLLDEREAEAARMREEIARRRGADEALPDMPDCMENGGDPCDGFKALQLELEDLHRQLDAPAPLDHAAQSSREAALTKAAVALCKLAPDDCYLKQRNERRAYVNGFAAAHGAAKDAIRSLITKGGGAPVC